MSSRLFTEVREKRGLAYYVRAMPDAMTDTGVLVITAGVRNEQAHEATTAIITELKRLRDGDITEDELNMHKDSVMGRLALRWEDSQSLADFYGEQQLLMGEVKSTEERLKELAGVSVERMTELAKEIVVDSGLSGAVIGPQSAAKLEPELTFE